MQVIGLNFTKLSAEKTPLFKSSFSVNTNINFPTIEKEKVDILKEQEVAKVNFIFSVSYLNSEEEKKTNAGEVIIEGNLIISLTKEESKEIFKYWKKKDLPPPTKLSLFNFLLPKCSAKALSLEEDVKLPYHIPMPQLQPSDKKQESS